MTTPTHGSAPTRPAVGERDTGDDGAARPGPAPERRWWTTALWLGHGLLRFVLLYLVLVYAWAKLFETQMGHVDYDDALYAVGEKSPMGLLWTFMAYSPVVQFLAGAVELLAGVLLIWRRTAWIGGLLGFVSLGVVFLLNMTFDVPVKQLALAMTVGFLLVALPELPRLVRFAAGRPTGGFREPRPVPWPRVHAVSRWVLSGLGLLLVVGMGAALWTVAPPAVGSDSPLPGVYRVVTDAAAPAPQLAQDRRWEAIAFGRWLNRGTGQMTLRYANGDLREGSYRTVRDGVVEVSFYPVLAGDRGLVRDVERRAVLSWERRPDGRIAVSGDGQQLLVESDPELRYLFDRGFSWAPSIPINR